MSDLILLTKLKLAQYLNIDGDNSDTQLGTLISDVSQRAHEEMDRETEYDIDTVPADVSDAVCKQCAWEWKLRKDWGSTGTTYEDGTINKPTEEDDWLTGVRSTLWRHKEFDI